MTIHKITIAHLSHMRSDHSINQQRGNYFSDCNKDQSEVFVPLQIIHEFPNMPETLFNRLAAELCLAICQNDRVHKFNQDEAKVEKFLRKLLRKACKDHDEVLPVTADGVKVTLTLYTRK